MAEHYQRFFSIGATLGSPTTISFDVFSTTITDELILFFLAIKIYKRTTLCFTFNGMSELEQCWPLNSSCSLNTLTNSMTFSGG